MKKVLYSLLIMQMLISCNNTACLEGTSWTFSDKEGNSILMFSDSTYKAKITHSGDEIINEYPYTIIEDTIYLNNIGSTTLKGVIKGDELIIYQSEQIELPDTFLTNLYQLIYKKQ